MGCPRDSVTFNPHQVKVQITMTLQDLQNLLRRTPNLVAPNRPVPELYNQTLSGNFPNQQGELHAPAVQQAWCNPRNLSPSNGSNHLQPPNHVLKEIGVTSSYLVGSNLKSDQAEDQKPLDPTNEPGTVDHKPVTSGLSRPQVQDRGTLTDNASSPREQEHLLQRLTRAMNRITQVLDQMHVPAATSNLNTAPSNSNPPIPGNIQATPDHKKSVTRANNGRPRPYDKSFQPRE